MSKYNHIQKFIIDFKMGKKGFIMDNGRTAQSSMALYWKKNKDKAKLPKQKHQEEDNKQITDKSVMTNFQKWKLHKEKVITKAYAKPPKQEQIVVEEKPKENDDDELMQQMMESKRPKIITIPGFKSKEELARRLQMQKPTEADQSTNVLRLPSHMESLTKEQIVEMLRERKSKKQMLKRAQARHQQNVQPRCIDGNDMILGDEYIDLKKKKAKQENEVIQLEKPVQEVKQPEPSYFKSDFLNKIDKEGLQTVLSAAHQKAEAEKQSIIQQQKSMQQSGPISKVQALDQKSTQTKPRIMSVNPKFLPRALKK